MNKTSSPKGAVAIIVAAGLFALLIIAAFAVDVGNYYVTRNELQNSADAGALGGAGRLVNPDGSIAWSEATVVAVDTGEKNLSANGVKPALDVTVGYWYLNDEKVWQQSAPTPTLELFPGVLVSAARHTKYGNAIPTFFANVIGIESLDSAASALAIISGPGYVDQRDLFPFVVSRCLYEKYWDYSADPPGPRLGATGLPQEFNALLEDPSCGVNSFAWTGLGVGSNAAAIKTVVRNYKTDTPIASQIFAIGDSVPVWGGSSVAPIGEIQNCLAQPKVEDQCKEVTVVVVESVPSNSSGQLREILAFSCLEILGANQQGNDKFVRVRMATSCPPPPSSGGIGPIYGTVTPPALVR